MVSVRSSGAITHTRRTPLAKYSFSFARICFEVLLGDKPALTPQQSFYQRVLTGDSAEATYQAELALKEEPLANYLDDVALKGLQLAERDF